MLWKIISRKYIITSYLRNVKDARTLTLWRNSLICQNIVFFLSSNQLCAKCAPRLSLPTGSFPKCSMCRKEIEHIKNINCHDIYWNVLCVIKKLNTSRLCLITTQSNWVKFEWSCTKGTRYNLTKFLIRLQRGCTSKDL